jgi:hypothetical protein
MLDVLYQLSPITHRSTKKQVGGERIAKDPEAKNHFGEFARSGGPVYLCGWKICNFPRGNIRFFAIFLSGVTL